MKEETKQIIKERTPRYEQREVQTGPKQKTQLKWGIAHIYASYNNTIIHITDITGTETLAKCSGGMVVKAHRMESSPTAAMTCAKNAAEQAKEKGIDALHIRIRAPGGHNGPMNTGPGANVVVKALSKVELKMEFLEKFPPTALEG